MLVSSPRLVIAGISGDSGKTLVSLALVAGFKKRGKSVAPFKKGPDYIDPAWLSKIAGAPCRNLDTFLVPKEKVLASFLLNSRGKDLSIIEGNRGLFDGRDISGRQSTAELARLIKSPIILVINCAKITRTVAALVKGCLTFEPGLNFAGVVLNQVAGDRHRRIITDSIEEYCGISVLGSIPKLDNDAVRIPERHLGLIPPSEFLTDSCFDENLAELAEKYLKLDSIYDIATKAGPLSDGISERKVVGLTGLKVGYFSDSIFTFYYPENLERLADEGAKLIPISSLAGNELPEIHALYIGGGFPETHARKLGENALLMNAVKSAAERGMPIYAECGGLIYLCRSLLWKETQFPMAGVFDLDLKMHPRPVGHGYTVLRVDTENPYFPVGTIINGHEFHYSGVQSALSPDDGCCTMETGVGLGNKRDGLLFRRTFASYSHIHADGEYNWARAFINLAHEYAQENSAKQDMRSVASSSSVRLTCDKYFLNS